MRTSAQLFLTFLALLTIFYTPSASAQEETGLCPENFREGIVTTGYVDCFRESSARSDREDAELLRLQREAECLAEPRSELLRSEIIVDRNGNFFASLTCRITIPVPAGTILCPEDTTEIFRAFDFLVCQYFGSASTNEAGANTALNEDIAACEAAPPGGTVLAATILSAESADDDEQFFFSDVSCGFNIPAVDIFECPVGFEEQNRTEDLLQCERKDEGLLDLASAIAINQQAQGICMTTTAGLGSVVFQQTELDTTTDPDTYMSEVDCDIALPRYGEYMDGDIVRACDATCTEDIEQTRRCINGQVGDPGCTEDDAQTITQDCNTGTDQSTACPIMGVPSGQIVPLLLLDEEEDE